MIRLGSLWHNYVQASIATTIIVDLSHLRIVLPWLLINDAGHSSSLFHLFFLFLRLELWLAIVCVWMTHDRLAHIHRLNCHHRWGWHHVLLPRLVHLR